MNKITDFNSIKAGDVFLSVSPQFGVASFIICISDDFTGMGRDIKYYALIDRIESIPTPEKFAEDMKNNKMTPHTFAIWGTGNLLFPLTDSKSHIKFCVSYSVNGKTYHGQPKVIDHYENFDNYTEALKTYKKVLEKENLFNANLSIVLKSTD